ncbi:MAG TPA: serine/threonine-protein kinase [Thermoanaerobaculia bacterium]|jgi:serine/threonine protein kinase|nr:serine/threonine-protein kinase [Thermoanaerobaculia bacterium]
MASAIPSSLGRYEVLEELGKGAMGVVYLARDPLIGRLVALKTFRASQAMHGSELVEYRTRFMREAQSAGILSHPHIVTIHDVVDGADGSGVTFIAMEYVRGSNLKELLMRGEALPLARVCDVVSQLAEALDYAHSKGVIHRDIKPANIIIDTQGKVKITDFGIARLETSDLTHEGQLLGTPNYMAPERILGHKVDHRTDIFSLGVVIYEMLTRQKPFQGENLTMVSHRIVYEPFTPPRQYAPGLPPGVVAVLEQALEKQPERRFASAGALAAKLREAMTAAAGSETTVAARSSLPPPIPPPPLPIDVLGGGDETGPDEEPPGSDTRDVAAIAAGVPPPPPAPPARAAVTRGDGIQRAAEAFPSPRRLALAGVAGLVLVLLVAAGGFAWLRSHTPAVSGPDAADRARARYRLLLQEARTELDAGRPEAALAALAKAMPLAPGDPDLERMGVRIRSQMAAKRRTAAEQQAQLSALLDAAQLALRSGNAAGAADLARQVLALVPGEPNATALLANAQAALDAAKRRGQQQQQQQQQAARPVPSPPIARPPGTAPATAAPSAGTQASTAPATLHIDFFTELPEGVLTIYAGPNQILGEPFKFYKRTGLFRNQPEAGRIEASRQMPAGTTTLRIYVALPKRAPVVHTLEAPLAAGSTRVLKIHFDRDAQIAASLQ